MNERHKFPARHVRTHYLIAATVPALIVLLSITGFVWAQKPVRVVVDGRTLEVKTHADDVGSLLGEVGVRLGAGDVVVPSPSSRVEAGAEIVVRRAVPIVLALGDQQLELDVVGETVADALVAAGADPSACTGVQPALSDPLRPHMVITVPDVFVRLERESVPMPPTTKTKKDPKLAKGRRVVVNEGAPGTMLRIYRVLVRDGIEGTRTLTAEEVVTPPVARVVAVGTAVSPTASVAAAKPQKPKARTPGRELTVVATGYSAQQPDLDNRTATGAIARQGVMAVDPDVIPLGTRVYVPGYGYAVAADTGGAISGTRVDLCFDTVLEAVRWGRRTVSIVILD